jgi:hypothetical protein
MFGGRAFSSESRYSYGYQLRSSPRRLVPLFVLDKLYTGTSKERKASSFNFMFRYKDDVLSLNNSNLVILFRIIVYPNSRPIELEIKDTTDTAKSVSYLDLHLDIDSGGR